MVTSDSAGRVTPDLAEVGWGEVGVSPSKQGKLYLSSFQDFLKVYFTQDKALSCYGHSAAISYICVTA